jgi:hypothetical protein
MTTFAALSATSSHGSALIRSPRRRGSQELHSKVSLAVELDHGAAFGLDRNPEYLGAIRALLCP